MFSEDNHIKTASGTSSAAVPPVVPQLAVSATPKASAPDKRWKIVEATMRRHGHRSDALIETLHTVQEYFGYIDDTSLRFVADKLGLPLSRVHGVVTFYHFFTMKPPGRHSCVVCTGTACYIKGAPHVLRHLGDHYGIEEGETTPDGELSILTARCVGSCSMAPAVVIDGELTGNLSPDAVLERVKGAVAREC